jgi:sugar lactone lactonase YvrE
VNLALRTLKRTVTLCLCGMALLLALCGVGMQAQMAAVAVAGGNSSLPAVSFSSSKTGAAPETTTLHFQFSSAATVGSVRVLTQGSQKKDFQLAAASTTCVARSYQSGEICSVAVSFAATQPGVRSGAVVLVDSEGAVLASVPLHGMGAAPLPVFNPGSSEDFAAGIYNAVAVDADVDVFAVDAHAGTVVEIAASGAQTTVINKLAAPIAIALDGAGNLYVADAGQSAVLEFLRGENGFSTTPIAALQGVAGVSGIAVNAAGEVVASDSSTRRVLLSQSGSSAAPQVIADFSATEFVPGRMAFDAEGNLYITSSATGQVAELFAVNGSVISGQPKIIISGLNAPQGIAIDAAGNLYIAESGGRTITELSAQTFNRQTLLSTTAATDLALDSSGNILLTTETSGVVRINRAAPQIKLSAESGATYAATVQNIGNTPLTLDAVQVRTLSANTRAFVQANTGDADCAAGVGLSAASSCRFYVDVAVASGTQQVLGVAQINSNSLNTTGAANAISFSAGAQANVGELAYQTTFPSTLPAGSSPGTVKVAVEDLTGAVITTSSAVVTLTIQSPDGTPTVFTVAAASGVATFNLSGTVLIEAGNYTFTTSLSNYTSATAVIAVTPLPTAARLSVTGYPVTTVAGTANTLQVTAYDMYGNLSTGFTGAVTLSSSDTTAVFNPASYAYTATDAGVHSFSATLNTIGRQSITATTSTASGSQQNINVSAAPGTTTLSITALHTATPITSIANGTAVSLNATVVNSTGVPIFPGLVGFYDTSAPATLQLVGTAQLLANGTASFSVMPGPGTHAYRAVFSGTKLNPTTKSATQTLAVSGLLATKLALTETGAPGNYTLSATLDSFGLGQPTGKISFEDQTASNTVIATSGSLSGGQASALPKAAIGVGSEPQSLVSADFNGDGIPDMAVLNTGSKTVSILLGNGDGSFTQAAGSPFAAGTDPTWIATGDFNSDGNADLAVVDYQGNAVIILLGNGDGTFTAAAASPVSVGSEPYAVVIGDFNGDGKPDMAVTLDSPGLVAVLLGNGDGSFTAASGSPWTVGQDPYQIVTGDFNGDGRLDLATADFGENTVMLLLGNGDGTFVPAANSPFTVGNNPSSLVAADLNNDGHLDLAVANLNDNTVSILLGDGIGDLTPASRPTLTVGAHPAAIVAVDFDGSGNLGLITANFQSTSYSALYNTGGANFQTATNVPTGSGPTALGVADLNHDGRPDLLVADYGSSTVSVYLGVESTVGTATNVDIYTPPATHNVLAVYPGDTNYLLSTSTTVPLASNAVNTTLTLQVAPAGTGADYGNTITLTATISPATANGLSPSGTVTFFDSAVQVGTATVTSAATTFTLPVESVGGHNYSASYSGGAGFNPSSSSSLAYTINKAGITASTSGSTAAYGKSGTAVVTITGEFTGAGIAIPTGTIICQAVGASAQTVTLNNGQATINLPSTLPAGSNAITVQYNGDGNYRSVSTTATVTVATIPLTITANNATRFYGTANPAFSGTISGAINGDTFTESFSTPATISSNVGSYPIIPSAQGPALSNYTVVAVNGTLTITQVASALVLQTSAASVNVGSSVTFTATAASFNFGTPTGQITFIDGSTTLGTGTLNGAGVATYTTSTLAAGVHVITATYPGDINFTGSMSNNVQQSIIVIAVGDFSITANPTSFSVAQGQYGTAALTIQPVANLSGTLNFTCSGAPALSQCTLLSQTLTLTGNNAAMTNQVTLATTGTDGNLAEGRVQGFGKTLGGTQLAGMAALPCLALLGIMLWRRKPGSKLPHLLAMLMLGILIMGVSGCASRNSPGTPVGTYTLTVTASSPTTPTAAHTATITVTITQ